MSFVYLLSFFKEMLNYSDKNKLTPEKVSELLCECLIGEDKLSQSTTKAKRESLVRAVSPTKGQVRMATPREGVMVYMRPTEIEQIGGMMDMVEEQNEQKLSGEQLK